jgi:hypothetical protein
LQGECNYFSLRNNFNIFSINGGYVVFYAPLLRGIKYYAPFY